MVLALWLKVIPYLGQGLTSDFSGFVIVAIFLHSPVLILAALKPSSEIRKLEAFSFVLFHDHFDYSGS